MLAGSNASHMLCPYCLLARKDAAAAQRVVTTCAFVVHNHQDSIRMSRMCDFPACFQWSRTVEIAEPVSLNGSLNALTLTYK